MLACDPWLNYKFAIGLLQEQQQQLQLQQQQQQQQQRQEVSLHKRVGWLGRNRVRSIGPVGVMGTRVRGRVLDKDSGLPTTTPTSSSSAATAAAMGKWHRHRRRSSPSGDPHDCRMCGRKAAF